MKILVITLFAFLISSTAVFAQKVQKADSIYYTVDTIKSPGNDHMLKIGMDGSFRYFAFQWQDPKNDQVVPTFYYNTRKKELSAPVNPETFGLITFVSLTKLIELSQQDGGKSFNKKHNIFFIERSTDQYIKHKVKLLIPQSNKPSLDFEVIKQDTLSKLGN